MARKPQRYHCQKNSHYFFHLNRHFCLRANDIARNQITCRSRTAVTLDHVSFLVEHAQTFFAGEKLHTEWSRACAGDFDLTGKCDWKRHRLKRDRKCLTWRMRRRFAAVFISVQCCDQLTAIKTGHPLTSITWPYRGLKCRPIEVEYFFEIIRWQITSFKWSQAQVDFFQGFISNMLCLCHYGPALLGFWFQTDSEEKIQPVFFF